MAKDKKLQYAYPSIFGSHKSMINQEKTAELGTDAVVILTDEFGDYTTTSDKLDSGLADPNRWAGSRLNRLFDKKAVKE